MKRFQFHVIKSIRCDRICQRSITIINKEKSFTLNNSPLSHYSLLIFLFKRKLSKRFIWACKNLIYEKKWHFFRGWYLKSRVVYQFTCASCGARYIVETNRHFHTRVNEHLFRDKNSHVFRHLNCSRHCRDSCDAYCFKIIDHAKTFSQLKIWENPEHNKQVEHVNLLIHWLA